MSQLTRTDLLSIDWLSLREQSCVAGKIGRGDCHNWSIEVKELLLPVNLYQKAEIRVVYKIPPELGLRYHSWLEFRVNHKMSSTIFIADGTAGQIDPLFPEGFYDLINAAPVGLANVYQPERIIRF